MIKKHFIFTLLLASYATLSAQTNEDLTIYLVRHAEKDHSSPNTSDLPLSKCGEQRAVSLSDFFSDVQLEAVYSTDFTRTINTAQPTATSKNISIQKYDASNLEDILNTLLELKQNALVVGHSNTTGYLAGMLVGSEGGDISMDIYDRIYQVTISGDSKSLHLLHSSFECDN